MIFVTEINPRKISGLTSFLVSADRFVPELQDIFNNLTVYYYFKKEHCWEISSVDLKLFLDQVTKLDSVQLKLLEIEPELSFKEVIVEEQALLEKAQYKPFKHQIELEQNFKFANDTPDWLKKFILIK